MSPAQQWDLIAELERRKALQAAQASQPAGGALPENVSQPAQACGGTAPDADDDES